MVLIDNLIIALVLISTVVGWYRGIIPEVLSLATWIAAVWVAWQYAPGLEPYVDARIDSPVLAVWISRVVLFVGVLLAGGLITELMSLAVEKTGLSGTNRSLGLMFGFCRGLLVLGVLVMFAQTFQLSGERWWQDSKLLPYGERIATVLRQLLPDSIIEHLEPGPSGADPATSEGML